jgi:branched-chain amino acid transport system permease protein
MNIKKYIPVLTLIISAFFIHITVSLFEAEYYLTQLTMASYYTLLIIGLSVLIGYAGQISLGHAGFFAIGGYTVAYLSTNNLHGLMNTPFISFLYKINFLTLEKNSTGTEILFVTPWISFFIAIILTIIIAYLIGIPVLKLKGHYLAMATLGFGIIILKIVLSQKIFGEADGITSLPAFNLLFNLKISTEFSDRIMNFYIAVAVLSIGIIFLLNLINSRAGRALRALHGNETAADSIGIDTFKYKLNIFVISAVYASVAGAMLTFYNSGIGPSEVGIDKSVRYVAIVAAGGIANIWGAFIMSFILHFLSLRGVFGSYDDIVFGLILIITIVFSPDNIFKEMLKNNFGFILKFKKEK